VDWSPGYREIAPPDWLRGILSCLWVGVSSPGPSSSTLVLPDAAADLIWRHEDEAMLAGPDTGPVPAVEPGGAVLVGARFLPGAAGAVLGVPMSEVLDQRVSPADIPALRGRMPSAALPPDRALQALARLIADLACQHPADGAMTDAARQLNRPAASAGSVATALELSERQFLRRCLVGVGYGPRTLQRILRFRRFVSAVDSGVLPEGLAGTAATVGYADQPHLTRECVRLSGLTPRALALVRAGGTR
jgi:hypothetical protein